MWLLSIHLANTVGDGKRFVWLSKLTRKMPMEIIRRCQPLEFAERSRRREKYWNKARKEEQKAVREREGRERKGKKWAACEESENLYEIKLFDWQRPHGAIVIHSLFSGTFSLFLVQPAIRKYTENTLMRDTPSSVDVCKWYLPASYYNGSSASSAGLLANLHAQWKH